MAALAERSGHRVPRFAVASVALFSMFFGSAEAQINHESVEPHPAITKKLGSLATHKTAVVHGATIRAPHLTPAEWADLQVTPAEFRAWDKVHNCEEPSSWHVRGGPYPGGLGISKANWIAYGGLRFAKTGAGATPDEQIIVGEHILRANHAPMPDQNGTCATW